MTQIELTSELKADLIDHMGTELNIVNSARVSFNEASEELTPKDEGLIRFLMKNRHFSPFEHCSITFLVSSPIFVAREWMRHRTQCLAPETPITCLQPNGTPYQRTIEHLYKTHHGAEAPERWIKNGKNRQGGQARTLAPGTDRYHALNKNTVRTLRVFDENTRTFTSGIMDSVYRSGVKELYAVKVGNINGRPRIIRASAEHPFLTKDGWVKVKDMSGDELLVYPGKVSLHPLGQHYPPSLRKGIGVWTTMLRPTLIGEGSRCYLCNNWFASPDLELDHIVPVTDDLSLALTISNLAPVCSQCHREKTDTEQGGRQGQTGLGERHVRLDGKPILIGEDMTYDISMSGPHHNFIADYVVVHNSYNEWSGRYSQLQPKFYVPNYDRPLIQKGKPGAYYFEVAQDDRINIELFRELRFSYQTAWTCYEYLLDELEVAKEVARMCLPVAVYTSWYATANLRNWINFLSLRAEEHALYEIRQVAFMVEEQLYKLYPVTLEAWDKAGRGSL